MAKKKKAQSSVKTRLLAALAAVALAIGLSLGVKEYRERQPKYAVGECLFDAASGIFLQITGVENGNYQYVAVILIFQVPGEKPIKEFNQIDTLVRIDCKTGEPINGKDTSKPESGSGDSTVPDEVTR